MSTGVLIALKPPEGWRYAPFRRVVARRREEGRPDLEPLSVFLDEGVVPRSSRDDNYNALGVNLSTYLVVHPGDLVFNKLRTWQGGLGMSKHLGIVSPAYFVCEPDHLVAESRYLHYLLRSRPYLAELTRISKWMPPAQFDIGWDDLRVLPVLLPPIEVQSRIADFLDRETARIDRVISARGRLLDLLAARDLSLTWIAITGADLPDERRSSGLDWLGSVPASWPIAAVSTQFEVQLGRMLNPERAAGPNPAPYVRNANVRWDSVDVTDLAEMDFPPEDRQRYRLEPGDVLVNEGGAGMGRTAIWRGEVDECYFQKSVLRLRPRGDSNPRWFVECMRVAVAQKLFLVEGNIATIPHLPAEALRIHRFPFPPRAFQERHLEWLDRQREKWNRVATLVQGQVKLLGERRKGLIAATVTGQVDVPEEPAALRREGLAFADDASSH